MNIRLEPLRDRILIRLRPQSEMTGSIVRVRHDQIARWADVLEVGPEVRDVQKGMGVLVNPLSGQAVGDDIILPESGVLATE